MSVKTSERKTVSVPGVEVKANIDPKWDRVLTDEALAFVAKLERRFGATRRKLLAAREERQGRLDRGELPGFLPETEDIRRSGWKVPPAPADLTDRRIEITGPVDRKMVINALNSGANVFMADFEDSLTPTWSNLLDGHINLGDAIAGTITHTEGGKSYKLAEKTATLIVRPRGWHLDEAHVHVDGAPMSGGLFDFGLYFFHNAKPLLNKGSGPYFYLPKMESHLEAKLWADVFAEAEQTLDIPHG